MITPPPTWQRLVGHELLVLVPPRGRGRIRYHERLAPRPFVAIVGELAGDARLQPGPVTRFITEEGELGAWCALRGVGEERRWIGAVLCDEFAAAIDGASLDRAVDETIARTTRSLIERASFGLGLRRRRFIYRRPAGWHGLAHGLVASYHPPDHPRRRVTLEVHPAEPATDGPDEAFDAILADEERRGLTRSGPCEVAQAAAARGLAGKVYAYAGHWPTGEERVVNHVAVLTDGHYRYVCRLETVSAPPDDRAVLQAVVASIERLPPAGGREPIAELAGITLPWLE